MFGMVFCTDSPEVMRFSRRATGLSLFRRTFFTRSLRTLMRPTRSCFFGLVGVILRVVPSVTPGYLRVRVTIRHLWQTSLALPSTNTTCCAQRSVGSFQRRALGKSSEHRTIHCTERGRATSVYNSDALGRPRWGVRTLAATMPALIQRPVQLAGYRFLGRGPSATGAMDGGWARSADLFFRCAACGDLMCSTQRSYYSCRCSAMYVDADAFRFGSRHGDENILVYRKSS